LNKQWSFFKLSYINWGYYVCYFSHKYHCHVSWSYFR